MLDDLKNKNSILTLEEQNQIGYLMECVRVDCRLRLEKHDPTATTGEERRIITLIDELTRRLNNQLISDYSNHGQYSFSLNNVFFNKNGEVCDNKIKVAKNE